MLASDILATAAELVAGDRARTHGDKLENFRNIAALWTAYLGHPITPVRVALMLALLKIARTGTGELNLDDYLDACGYAAIAGEIAVAEAAAKEVARPAAQP